MTTDTNEVSVRLFGVFRDLEPSSVVTIQTALPLSVSEFKNLIATKWLAQDSVKVDVRALLKSAALATEQTVLKDRDLIETAAPLALLPPVCGG